MKRKSEKPTVDSRGISAKLADFRRSYEDLFGVVPPLPGARIEFSGNVAPDFSLLAEQIRAMALAPRGIFDVKLIQLICFGMLLVEGHEAAFWHAKAARRNGASWDEFHKIVELATVVTSGFGALNRGGALLAKLRKEEDEFLQRRSGTVRATRRDHRIYRAFLVECVGRQRRPAVLQ